MHPHGFLCSAWSGKSLGKATQITGTGIKIWLTISGDNCPQRTFSHQDHDLLMCEAKYVFVKLPIFILKSTEKCDSGWGLYFQRDTQQIYFSYQLWERKLSAVFCRSSFLWVAYKRCKDQELCSVSVICNFQRKNVQLRLNIFADSISSECQHMHKLSQFSKGCESWEEHKNGN